MVSLLFQFINTVVPVLAPVSIGAVGAYSFTKSKTMLGMTKKIEKLKDKIYKQMAKENPKENKKIKIEHKIEKKAKKVLKKFEKKQDRGKAKSKHYKMKEYAEAILSSSQRPGSQSEDSKYKESILSDSNIKPKKNKESDKKEAGTNNIESSKNNVPKKSEDVLFSSKNGDSFRINRPSNNTMKFVGEKKDKSFMSIAKINGESDVIKKRFENISKNTKTIYKSDLSETPKTLTFYYDQDGITKKEVIESSSKTFFKELTIDFFDLLETKMKSDSKPDNVRIKYEGDDGINKAKVNSLDEAKFLRKDIENSLNQNAVTNYKKKTCEEHSL